MSGWVQLARPRRGPRGRLSPARRLHGLGLLVGSSAPRGAMDLPGRGRGSGVRATMDGLRDVAPRVLGLLGPAAVHPPAGAGEPAAVARPGWRPPRPGVQHRRLVPHEHELAVVLGRDDDGASGPDDRARRPELPVGGGRDGRRRRARPGIHARRGGHDRQLLVGHGAIHRADPAPDRVRVRARLHLARGRPEPARVPHRSHRDRWHPGDPGRAGRLAGGDQGARQQRWRLLQRQLRPPVREPQPAHELPADVPDPRDPVRVDRHVRQAGRQPQAGIRARGRDGRSSGSAAR